MKQKRKDTITIIMGILVSGLWICVPMVIPLIYPDIVFSIGGTNFGVLFAFSSPMMGYYIGEAFRSEEEDQLNTKSTGFAFCGMYLGFLIIIAFITVINFSNQDDQFISLILIGVIGFVMAIITFFANITDLIKNSQFSEENFKNILSIVGIIGFYQFLSSSYFVPILQAPNENSVWFLFIYLIIAFILGLFLLREVIGLIPEVIIDHIERKLPFLKKLRGP